MEAAIVVIVHEIKAACNAPNGVALFLLSEASEAVAAVVQDINSEYRVRS